MRKFSIEEIIFITSVVAIDLASGVVLKPITSFIGISSIIKIEMIIPFALIFYVRNSIPKFGAIIIYELLWGLGASFLIPMSFKTPGLLKLIPAFMFALTFEILFFALPKRKSLYLWGSAIIGTLLNHVFMGGFKYLMGFPFTSLYKTVFLTQMATYSIVAILALLLSFSLEKKFSRDKLLRRFRTIEL
ncbi:hypothetical protein JXR93_06635, partial [bacterium]|nr:hypothetical protein [bacterium]